MIKIELQYKGSAKKGLSIRQLTRTAGVEIREICIAG